MYNRKTPLSMQDADLCHRGPDPHILRISFTEADRNWHFELLKEPPCGLSSARITAILDDFTYALQARQRNQQVMNLHCSQEEKKIHANWLNAHALVLETDAKMARTLASHLGRS